MFISNSLETAMDISRRYLPKEVNRTVTCPKYAPELNSKRCTHYLNKGACSLATEFMCIEWLKANKQVLPTDHPVFTPQQTSLFDGGSLGPTPKAKSTYQSKPQHQPEYPSPQLTAHEPQVLQVISKEDIESFKALHVEVCVHSDTLGDIWLVP